jgi:hypothetical protein
MKYYLKVNGSSRATQQTINLRVDYDSAYVNVCWLGVITDEGACFGDDVQTYCESVYIGINGCSERTSRGSIDWHGCTINYVIVQEPDPNCENCSPTTCSCEKISSYISPHILSVRSQTLSGITDYWFTTEDACGNINRTKKTNVTTFPCPDITEYNCKKEDRNKDISWHFSDGDCSSCSFTLTDTCYVAMPDNCCDTPTGTCYEISDIYYVNSAGTLINDVSPSGETIWFYFDYKKIETDEDCNTKTSFGRFDGRAQDIKWIISGCTGSGCCKSHKETSGYTWTNHKSCVEEGVDVVVPLSITRRKDVNYTGDCSSVCEADTGYCVDVSSIKKFYKDTFGNWITVTDDYAFPHYGGSMKVVWEYSAITVYDDCSSGVTSGNTYEDIIDILPYSAESETDCYDESKCYNLALTSQTGNRCNGGSANFSATKNTSQQKYADRKVDYIFKKSPCDIKEEAKSALPPSLVTCTEGQKKCNEFEVTYKQDKTPCKDNCDTCVTTSRYRLQETTSSSFTDSYSGCELKLIDHPNWVSVNVGGNSISYSVEANEGSDREGGVTFQVNGMNCYDTVIIWQKGANNDEDEHDEDPVVECDCDNATFSVYPANILPGNGGSNLVIGSYIYDDCVTSISVEGGGGECSYTVTYSPISDCSLQATATKHSGGEIPSWIQNVTYRDGFIYAGTITPNDSSQSERTATLQVSFSTEKGACPRTESLTVTQNKGACSISLESDGTEICQKDGGTVTFTVKNN